MRILALKFCAEETAVYRYQQLTNSTRNQIILFIMFIRDYVYVYYLDILHGGGKKEKSSAFLYF